MTNKSKLETLCLVDSTFPLDTFRPIVTDVIDYCNDKLEEVDVDVNPTTLAWEPHLPKKYRARFDAIDRVTNYLRHEGKDYDVTVYFANSVMFYDRPWALGVCKNKNKIIVQSPRALVSNCIGKSYLKKVTLHELGHVLGLKDSYGWTLSIMDNIWGAMSDRFTQKQKQTIRKRVADLS